MRRMTHGLHKGVVGPCSLTPGEYIDLCPFSILFIISVGISQSVCRSVTTPFSQEFISMPELRHSDHIDCVSVSVSIGYSDHVCVSEVDTVITRLKVRLHRITFNMSMTKTQSS